MDQKTKNIFIPGPMATFCHAHKLNRYSVRAKLYAINELLVHIDGNVTKFV